MSNRSRVVVALLISLVVVTTRATGQDGEYGYEVRRHDTIVLENGQELDGTILEENSDFVEFLDDKNIKTQYRRGQIQKIIAAVTPAAAYRNRTRHSDYRVDRFADQLALGRWAAQYADEIGVEAISNLERATRLDPTQLEPYELVLPLLEQHPGSARGTRGSRS